MGATLRTSCCKVLYTLGMGLRCRTSVPCSIRLEKLSYNQGDMKMTVWDSARETAIFGYLVTQSHFLGYPFVITFGEMIQSRQGCLSDILRIRL